MWGEMIKRWDFSCLDVSVPTTKASPTRGWYWATEAHLHEGSVCDYDKKNEDIWFCDSNDFTMVYSPNEFIYIAELSK